MNKFAFAAAFGLASAVLATPAFAQDEAANANEIRVEGRAGYFWGQGFDDATVGVAAGYDLALGDLAFAGAEVSADKILTDGTKVSFGASGRLGLKTNETGKFYVAGGWNSEPCDACVGAWNVGLGLQQGITGNFYAKGEFRHIMAEKDGGTYETALFGIGMTF
ncbi:hypothetical protein [Altererythrobacter fulvus]|uniref:hypothetical protein n=1 Tax=Caenibius fulvus TaxID=2126012 RepID=UPI00301A6189